MSSSPSRRFPVAVNAEALALAWARQEAAQAGSVVIVDHEISPRGRLGRLWPHPAERTAVLAAVWRPTLDAERADLVWLAASLGLLTAARSLVAAEVGLWWPDGIVTEDTRRFGEVRAEIQLGPGRVVSAVVTARLHLDHLGLPDRDDVLAAMIEGLEEGALTLDAEQDAVCSAYVASHLLTGRIVTARLLPRGAVRGTVGGVDDHGRLELVSSTGLVERVPVDNLDRLEIATPLMRS